MIELRRALKSDAEALAQLGKQTFMDTFADQNRKEDMDTYVAQTFGREFQEREIGDSARSIEIAWIDSQPAGFLHLLEGPADPSVTGPRPIELLRLYVDARWHGKGVGARLMDRCIQIAKENRFETLWLGVWENNFRAQAFYRKYAFQPVGSHIFRLGSDDQTDIILSRSI